MNDPVSPTQSTFARLLNQYWRIAGVVLLLLALIIYFKYRDNKHVVREPGFAVVAGEIHKKNVPVYLSALGNVTATYTITVKTQISGLLMKVLFTEGQLVKKGDLLAEIDQRLLLAQFNQYQGQLKRDEALLANAHTDLARYQRLWKQDSIAQQTLATQESLVRQYQGSVEIDRGLLETTNVNLAYCQIVSPVDGRVGLRLVDPGNYVQAADTTGIAVITTLDPITVIFSIPENDVSKVVPQLFANRPITVEAYDREQHRLLATGSKLIIDNLIDPTTGTVKLRAQFNNPGNKFFPNQFVNIKLIVAKLNHAIVAPTAAIQQSSKGNFVFLINQDLTVSSKAVELGVSSGDDTVIKTGLTAGQRVVVEGGDKLTDGATVRIVASNNAATPAVNLAKKN